MDENPPKRAIDNANFSLFSSHWALGPVASPTDGERCPYKLLIILNNLEILRRLILPRYHRKYHDWTWMKGHECRQGRTYRFPKFSENGSQGH